MGQGIARDLAANAEMVKLALLRAQASFDIAQTLAIGELREGHTKELIPARKTLEFVVALVAFDTTSKSLGRKKVHQLCKDRFARIHQPSATAKVAHAAAGLVLISNRSLCASGLTFSLSITYGQWANKRWNSTDLRSEIFSDSSLQAPRCGPETQEPRNLLFCSSNNFGNRSLSITSRRRKTSARDNSFL